MTLNWIIMNYRGITLTSVPLRVPLLRTAQQSQVISGPSSVQPTMTSSTRVSPMSGSQHLMTPQDPAHCGARLKGEVSLLNWPPRCWMGRDAGRMPLTCASVECVR